jgi:hypothetical protein
MNENCEWKYTRLIHKMVNDPLFYVEPKPESRNGKWLGRPIIGRDTPINGGVYLVGGIDEAVVVDDTKQPELIETYQQLKQIIAQRTQQKENYKKHILDDTFDLVQQVMPYSMESVVQISRELSLKPDQKVALSAYINNQGGVCRHQALLCAYLLEKLKSEGFIRGQASIDRNSILGKGGHAWVRYTNSVGEIFIIDPAQDFLDKLNNAGENEWFYQRPED